MPNKIELKAADIQFIKQHYTKHGPKYCYQNLNTNMSFSTFKKKCYNMRLSNKPRLDYISKIFPVNQKSAYFLGFFCGDGYIVNNKGNLDGINIEINSEDANSLYNDFMFLPFKTYVRHREKSWKPTTTFSISNRPLAKYLDKLGFTHKSIQIPNINISNKYKHLFLRGYIDADGHIKKRHQGSILQLANTYDFNWNSLLNLFPSNIDTSHISIYKYIHPIKKHKSSRLTIQHTKTIISILNYVYQNKTNIGLPRKYKEYLKIKQSLTPD